MSETAATALDSFDTGRTGTPIGPALTVEHAEHWDDECDLLVVGCGLAGATSALKAAENPDVSVIVIDRFDGGGSSQQSGGVLYLGGGTPAQQELGLADTVEGMVNYLSLETGNAVSRDTLERFSRDNNAIIAWLERFGIRFGGPATEAKTSYPNRDYLYYSGNERLRESTAVAPPAPRGHRVKPRPGGGGSGLSGDDLMIPLKDALDAAPNIDFQRRTSATRLLRDVSGRVIGAEVRQIPPGSIAARLQRKLMQANGNMTLAMLGISRPMLLAALAIERSKGRPRRIRARDGVVLASGGYMHNRRMLAEESPTYRHVAPIGTAGDDGSGIMLGRSVGGACARLETVSAWRFLYPPAGWSKGVLVGPSGERIVNEEAYGARTGAAMFERAGGRAWLVMDEPLLKLTREQAKDRALLGYQRMTIGAALRLYTKSAPTLADLAHKIGLPRDTLTQTILQYNGDIESGRPDQFGKASTLCTPILKPPFSAVDLSHYTRLNPLLGITVGGLKVDETSGAVLDENERPIAGLFAAGRTAVGLPSNLYVSGLSLSDCLWSGWRAAEAATASGGSGLS